MLHSMKYIVHCWRDYAISGPDGVQKSSALTKIILTDIYGGRRFMIIPDGHFKIGMDLIFGVLYSACA